MSSFVDPNARRFSVIATSGITNNLTVGGETLLSFRSATRGLTRLTSISAGVQQIAGFGAIFFYTLALFPARSFTVSDSGGFPVTLPANNGKAKSGQATSLLADLRVADVAGLTLGTRTLDTQVYSQANLIGNAAANVNVSSSIAILSPTTHPALEMLPNEGAVVRLGLNPYPDGTGVVRFVFALTWEELG